MLSTVRVLALPVLAMTLIVVASNVLVQHPIPWFGLEDYLTWGALTYPVSFLVTDLTNRRYGVGTARRLVVVGFVIAVVLSIALATPRIALASGTAFLVGQLLDVTVFNRLRRDVWWHAPLAGSLVGSALDTALFFSIAFAGIPAMSGLVNFAGFQVPLWTSLAMADFGVKVTIALLALIPYGALLNVVLPVESLRRPAAAR
ncbi:queuosine precursor transporter [Alsobacter sp. SYSU M60028]|uniref:Probable queuosine precursor transporter n=1 Tax=Alsobacter ponti TaxID=2962936 RepID=A0ABT1LDZ8_9HYPH|nr:queuosine precursor transporter [Alsobacter ponti]MCP8938960.1 queuosine precursor transporter [Alsobacter ponti]